MAEIVRLEEILVGWRYSLNCLVPNQDIYSTGIFQCAGEIEANNQRIGNANRAIAFNKHSSFLNDCTRNEIDLVVTPEYSTPWEIIEEVRHGRVGPGIGKLWVLGMESILPAELLTLSAGFAEAKWIFENPPAALGEVFLDPVCILFRARNPEGIETLVILIQFKCQPMRDGVAHLERRYLIKGTKRYRLRNGPNSVHLLPLICADAFDFEFNRDLEGPDSHLGVGWLFVHVQLILEPYYEEYKEYRSGFFRHSAKDDVEYLCVNWAKGFSFQGLATRSGFGGSAHYFRSEKPDLSDARLNVNHEKGVYLACQPKHKVLVNVFNYDEHYFVFRLSKAKISIGPAPGQRDKTGLEAVGCFSYVGGAWTICAPDDGFLATCVANAVSPAILLRPDLTPMDKERFGSLALALVNSDSLIDPTSSSLFFLVGPHEALQRLTVVQQPNRPDYDGEYGTRVRRLQDIRTLENSILSRKKNFPKPIKEFFGISGLHYENTPTNLHFNLYSADRKKKALVAYVGNTSKALAERHLENLEALFKGAFARVIVWHNDGAKLNCTFSEFAAKADAEPDRSKKKITKEIR